jgi:hypothetical protein
MTASLTARQAERDGRLRLVTGETEVATRTGATVIPGHDKRVRDTYPTVEGPAAGIATLLSS